MTAEEQLVSLLRKKGYHISTAESCTGGMIASSIVDISGASDVFEEGYVTSLGLIQFMIELEEKFNIRFTDDELYSEDIRVVGSLAELIEKKMM